MRATALCDSNQIEQLAGAGAGAGGWRRRSAARAATGVAVFAHIPAYGWHRSPPVCARFAQDKHNLITGKLGAGIAAASTSCVKRLPGITQCASVRRVPVCQERPRARTRGDALCTMLRFARQRRRAKDERKN